MEKYKTVWVIHRGEVDEMYSVDGVYNSKEEAYSMAESIIKKDPIGGWEDSKKSPDIFYWMKGYDTLIVEAWEVKINSFFAWVLKEYGYRPYTDLKLFISEK